MTRDNARDVETTAALYGVEAAWVDTDGRQRRASTDVILEVLSRLGAPIAGRADLADAVRLRRRAIWERPCPPVRTAPAGGTPSIPLRLPAGRARGPLEWRLACERGGVRSGAVRVEGLGLAGGGAVDGRSFEIRRLELPADLPVGYHRLLLRHGPGEFRIRLLVTPSGVFRDPRLERSWGVFHPLPGLRDRRAGGVGDLRTLREALEWTAARGGAVFGTTPLVARFGDPPVDPSPYAPASRLFWDDRHVELEAAPGYAEARAAGELTGLDDLAGHESDELVPWDALTRAREAALAALAARFYAAGGERSPDFRRFLAARPDAGDFARFLAARALWGKDWRNWPEPARSGRPPADALDRRIVRRHLFGQWVAARQIERLGAAGRAVEGGTTLFLDVPLGSHPDGYDVWRRPELFVSGVASGAPPDPFFPRGQDWGLPPLHPERIREDGFEYVAAVLRHAMAVAGLVRIDHVMQMYRLFWIPAGARPTEGAYVRYPADELAAVVTLESHRAACDVAGEDLGTVPDAVRELMDRWGIRRTHVLGFCLDRVGMESDDLGVPAGAVATVETHDMVPLAGLRDGVDLRERVALGLLEPAEAEALLRRRTEAFRRLDERFGVAVDRPSAGAGHDTQRPGSAPSAGGSACDPLLEPLLAHLGASAAGLVVVPLDDLFGVLLPQNQPGTGTERPNWRRRLPAPLDSELPPGARRALEALRAARDAAPGEGQAAGSPAGPPRQAPARARAGGGA